jgi:hypothetical protein
MDAQYELHGQAFAWDLEKAAANLQKHHVAFEEACEVFFDPFLVLIDAGGEEESREGGNWAHGGLEPSGRRTRRPAGWRPPHHLGPARHTLGEEGL